jgi:hypothetical protein
MIVDDTAQMDLVPHQARILLESAPHYGCPWLLNLRLAPEGECAPQPHDATRIHVWRSQEGADVAYGFRRSAQYWMHWPSFATYGFALADRFVTAYPAPGCPLSDIFDVYGRSVLPIVLQVLGFEALHASAIVSGGGVVVFAGRSKVGKSTLAFGLSGRGFRQWSDDAVVFRMAGDTPEAVPLPFTVRLRPNGPVAGAPSGEIKPQKTPLPITGVCLLSRLEHDAPGAPTRIRAMRPVEALQGFLTHAHEFDPSNMERRRRMLDAYLALAAVVPTFEVQFRADSDAFDDFLDRIMTAIGWPAPEGM